MFFLCVLQDQYTRYTKLGKISWTYSILLKFQALLRCMWRRISVTARRPAYCSGTAQTGSTRTSWAGTPGTMPAAGANL